MSKIATKLQVEQGMALLVVYHKVHDYAAWRPAYDAHEPARAAAGISNGRVFRRAEDPNDLVILLDVDDVDRARAWAASADLKAAMQNAGVVGEPVIHIVV
jgi:hypothetical protein